MGLLFGVYDSHSSRVVTRLLNLRRLLLDVNELKEQRKKRMVYGVAIVAIGLVRNRCEWL